MSCYMHSRRRQELKDEISGVAKDVSKVAKDVASLEKRLSGDLSDIAAQIFKRLDVMEQAIADPDGPAAETLRKKHGIGKQGPVRPIGTLSKKAGG